MENIKVTEHTRERLKELQALPLERKVGFTCARITEWYNHYKGQVYVSFSGGKDSTVLLHIARSLYPDIKAMFVDTGLEYPEIKQFVKTFDNVDIIRPKISFKEVLQKYGYPVIGKEVSECIYEGRRCDGKKFIYRLQKLNGTALDKNGNPSLWNYSKYKYLLDAPFLISHKCCDVMKKRPAKQYKKETGLMPIVGTMTEESRLRTSTWLRQGCNAYNKAKPMSAPMSFWTEQDVLRYLKLKNIPIASVYGDIEESFDGKLYTTGCHRTGCVFCLFGIHLEKEPNRIQRLYYTHPKLYKYCLEDLGLQEVMEYINVPYEPVTDLFGGVY